MAPRRGRGRRPTEQVRADVVAAATGLLYSAGLAAITFERVAALAAVSRTTLHKWWPSPSALAADAYFASVEDALAFPDTGDVRTDVRTQLLAFVDLLQHRPAGRAAREIIGAAQSDDSVRAALRTQYAIPRRDLAVAALQRAQQRGQIRPETPLDVLVDQLWGACYHRLLVLDEPVDAHLVDALVANAFDGAAPR